MEVHRQRCQACQSIDVRNILVRRQGEPTAVYVRCANCGELVARYQLSDYYHHGKGPESFYRSIGADACDSGRRALEIFNRAKEDSIQGFKDALERLKEENKEV
ncbi:MAG: hypothetical protein P1V20_23015 [Verrucomicrobiales bacterium]|nr:hypothetical protein [Verrucomicrobiales bacterium]